MNHWQHFLDSLSTKGGNIVVALVVMVLLGAALLHTFHDATDSMEARILMASTFSGFAGALLAMLKGDSSRQQMIDRRESVLPAPPEKTGGDV